MGLDVEIYIRTEPTSDMIRRIHELSKERNEDSSCRYPVIQSVVALHCRDGRDRPCINVSSASRYFGPYYARGWWPDIKAALLAIREVCPGVEIEYGNDGSDFTGGHTVDDAFLAQMDALWETTGKR